MAESSEAAASSGAAAKPQQKSVGLSMDRSESAPYKPAGPFAEFADPNSGFNKVKIFPAPRHCHCFLLTIFVCIG